VSSSTAFVLIVLIFTRLVTNLSHLTLFKCEVTLVQHCLDQIACHDKTSLTVHTTGAAGPVSRLSAVEYISGSTLGYFYWASLTVCPSTTSSMRSRARA
jgi:hypothetical protein